MIERVGKNFLRGTQWRGGNKDAKYKYDTDKSINENYRW